MKVDGVSERQCERFGQKLVNCVGTFCKDHSLEADNFEDFTDSASSTASQVIFRSFGIATSVFFSFYMTRLFRCLDWITLKVNKTSIPWLLKHSQSDQSFLVN